MVIRGRHCAAALSRLKKSTSYFAALTVRRACWLQYATLSTSGLHSQGDVFFLTAVAGWSEIISVGTNHGGFAEIAEKIVDEVHEEWR